MKSFVPFRKVQMINERKYHVSVLDQEECSHLLPCVLVSVWKYIYLVERDAWWSHG